MNITSNAEITGGITAVFYQNSNVNISNTTSAGTFTFTGLVRTVGGFIGSNFSSKLTVTSSSSSADITHTPGSISGGTALRLGGFIGRIRTESGYTSSSYSIENCSTSGSLFGVRLSSGPGAMGGFIGSIEEQKGSDSYIKNSSSTASISSQNFESVGGFIGSITQKSENLLKKL